MRQRLLILLETACTWISILSGLACAWSVSTEALNPASLGILATSSSGFALLHLAFVAQQVQAGKASNMERSRLRLLIRGTWFWSFAGMWAVLGVVLGFLPILRQSVVLWIVASGVHTVLMLLVFLRTHTH